MTSRCSSPSGKKTTDCSKTTSQCTISSWPGHNPLQESLDQPNNTTWHACCSLHWIHTLPMFQTAFQTASPNLLPTDHRHDPVLSKPPTLTRPTAATKASPNLMPTDHRHDPVLSKPPTLTRTTAATEASPNLLPTDHRHDPVLSEPPTLTRPTAATEGSPMHNHRLAGSHSIARIS